MTSRERVIRAIDFYGPDRIPVNFDSNRTPDDGKRYGEDFRWVFLDPNPSFPPRSAGAPASLDEWGVLREAIGMTMGEAKGFPLAEVLDISAFKVPNFRAPERYASIEVARREGGDLYMLGMYPSFLFLHMLDLFGFETLMIRLGEENPIVEAVAERLTEEWIAVTELLADRGVDGVIAIEDLGLQDRLIISPTMWRRVYKERYCRIVDAVHRRGMHFFIHSCGHILDLIEDFIEIGVDVLQIDQQENMGVDRLAERYAGRICFFCPVDIQTVLPSGPVGRVEEYARKLAWAFGSPSGGFLAKTYPQPEAIGIPESHTAAMCAAFRQADYGKPSRG